MGCDNQSCKSVSPKFRLTWCNVKTIILLALTIYVWVTSK